MKIRIFLFLTFFINLANIINGQSDVKSIFDKIYFATDSIPTLTLETDWNRLINKKDGEEYQAAKITIPNMGGEALVMDMKLRSRGMMRKQVCFFPPIKLNFGEKDLTKHGLDTSVDKIKLVFQCKTGSANSEYLIREKLAYKLYSIINPYSMMYRQIKVDCVEEGKVKYSLDAMIIEDEEEITDRLGAKVITEGKIMSPALEHETYVRMCIFQYMIGNTDWSIPNKHNIEMVKLPGIKMVVPIAYDFDYAALVGTPYAVPHESLPIQNVSERYFMGHGVTEADALSTAKYFLEKKQEVLDACNTFPGLSESTRKTILKFITPFFDKLASEKDVKRNFVQE